jgi:nitrite reductase/ring-hydroxylating ferredoxin subunit
LIPVSDIPESGTVSAELLGREVLVTMVNGKPRPFINVCMHHGGPVALEDDRFTCQGTGRSSTFARDTRSQDPSGPMED